MASVVMILTNSFASDYRVYKEAIYLIGKGHDIEVLSWDRENDFPGRRLETVDGIKVRRFNFPGQYGTGFRQLGSYLKFMQACGKHITSLKHTPEYIHCHDLDGMLIGMRFAPRSSKLIFDMHEDYELRRLRRVKKVVRQLVKHCIHRSYKSIHCVPTTDTPFPPERTYPSDYGKLVWLPNYTNMEVFSDITKTPSANLRIAFVGKLLIWQVELFAALMEAASEFENVEVAIHGEGYGLEDLKRLAQKYPNARVTGRFIKQLDGERLYKNTDILFSVYHPRNVDYKYSIPTKFFEAINTRTPLIVHEDSVMGTVCKREGIGFTVEPEYVTSIRKIIKKSLEDRTILNRMAKKMGAMAGKYTWDNVVTNLDEIYGKR